MKYATKPKVGGGWGWVQTKSRMSHISGVGWVRLYLVGHLLLGYAAFRASGRYSWKTHDPMLADIELMPTYCRLDVGRSAAVSTSQTVYSYIYYYMSSYRRCPD